MKTFSLLSLILLMIFAALGMALWVTRSELADKSAELERFRQESLHPETARKEFEAAFKIEMGSPPSASTTENALSVWKSDAGGMATRLGKQEGIDARHLQNLQKSIDDLTATEFIDAIQHSSVRSLTDTGFSKSSVAKVVTIPTTTQEMDGRLLLQDPTLIKGLKANTKIKFPVGTYTFDEQTIERNLESKRLPFPNGIRFVGAGKYKTTLKFSGAGLTNFDVNNLSFSDMTIDCDNDGMFDKRQGKLTVRLDKTRIVRFDAGHGGCKLFSINEGLIVHATDTDFIGGYGSSPGNGNVFDSNRLVLGHFERCTFSGIKYELFRKVRNHLSFIWMDDCEFDRKPELNRSVELNGSIFDMKPGKRDWVPEEDTKFSGL